MCCDDRLNPPFEPPSGCNTLNLTGRFVTVAAGADQRRVGTPADPIERRIVGPVEEVLHFSGHGRKIFRRGEDITVGLQYIIGCCVLRMQQSRLDAGFGSGSAMSRFGHLPRSARERMKNE
jgi:hypothetical protein